MWAVGAVGVLEERNACGRWVWGEGGKRACGGGGEGGGGGVRAVRDVRAVRAVRAVGAVGAVRALRVVGAGGAGGRAGAAIEHYFLFSFLNSEYGSMWAVGAVGVLEERNACGRWVWGAGGKRACGGGGEGGGGEGAEGGGGGWRGWSCWGNNTIFSSLFLHVGSAGGGCWRRGTHVGGGCGARAVSARAVGAVRGGGGEGSEGCEGGEGGGGGEGAEGGGGGWRG